MPFDGRMGYNKETTAVKQEWFSRFALFHLDWARLVMSNNQFFDRKYAYWDLTAGAGYSEAYGYGSPVLHALAAERHRAKHEKSFWVRAKLIEKEPDTARALERETVKNQDVMLCRPAYDSKVYYTDYREQIDEFLRCWKEGDKLPLTGLVYYDSNGQIPDIETLRTANCIHPRLDVLMHISAANVKRVAKSFGRESLTEILAGIGKKNWLVSELGGMHQWAFLFGTNYVDLKEWRKIKLYSIHSLRGYEILRKLNFTSKELAAVGVGSGFLW